MRYQATGMRVVMATTQEALLSFMKSRTPGILPTLSQAWVYFRSISEELLCAFLESQGKGLVHTCTVGEGDVLFCPPGWVVADRGAGPFNTGIKLSIVEGSHFESLNKLYKELISKGMNLKGSGPILKAALDLCKPDGYKLADVLLEGAAAGVPNEPKVPVPALQQA